MLTASARCAEVLTRYEELRRRTELLAAQLSPEDQLLQSMPLCSPTKWHRAHTTWFFETFVLAPQGIPTFDPSYGFLFNSYYEGAGERHERAQRGLLSRPTARQIDTYRRHVDARIYELLADSGAKRLREILPIIELGIAHEEQHQELILTDILHAFSLHPERPAYRPGAPETAASDAPLPLTFHSFEGGVREVGAREDMGFVFDNEQPRHRVWLEPFAIANRVLSVRELRAFILDKGYETPSLWLSDGWEWVQAQTIKAPLHARFEAGKLLVFTLEGARTAHDDEPICHVSFYEADAIARYLGARLPTEQEWEAIAEREPIAGRFLDFEQPLYPQPAQGGGLQQLYGDVWEWTRSAYEPYPGYRPRPGVLGEYNGKFMANQCVLRGGSFATPPRHVRATYRNYWAPATRFQFTGIRLAKSLH